MDGCKEICQRQTEMEKARRPMFQQELEELRSKVRQGRGDVGDKRVGFALHLVTYVLTMSPLPGGR